MNSPRVPIVRPPGDRVCGGQGGHTWEYARDVGGGLPFLGDVEFLRGRFPSDESRAIYMRHVHEHMTLATQGRLPGDLVVQMQCAPDVLELKLPDWYFSGGKMHVRLYFSEPVTLPGLLIGLRILTKRPGPIGLADQDRHAGLSSDLLLEYQNRGFR